MFSSKAKAVKKGASKSKDIEKVTSLKALEYKIQLKDYKEVEYASY